MAKNPSKSKRSTKVVRKCELFLGLIPEFQADEGQGQGPKMPSAFADYYFLHFKVCLRGLSGTL